MRLRLVRRALADAKRRKTWWQRNRPDATHLFEQELGATLERIAASPGIGQRVERRDGDVWVRRWLMPKTHNHVYYAIEGTEIVVLAIWGAPRGRGPKLWLSIE
jgi:plasmid stabilization system protein ParE